MSVTVTVNGTNYTIPETGDEGWGDEVTSWIQATSLHMLQKTGGLFTLSAEVDFGANFGLTSVYYKSRTAGIAQSGVLRLANVDKIGIRDTGGSNDLLLGAGSTDEILEYAGKDIVNIDSTQTLSNKTYNDPVFTGTVTLDGVDITNSNIDSSPIGATTPSTGAFTSVDVDGGTIDNTAIGSTTPSSGAFSVVTMSGDIDVAAAGNFTVGASVGANNMTLGGATSTVVVAGDLQVDGTTTTVNSQTLDVADANVTVNVGGNDAAAEGAGLTVERTGTDGSISYEDALASKWKVGQVGSEVEVVTVSATQTLTNKVLTGNEADTLVHSGGGTLTFPNVTDTVVVVAGSQTLTNKTITAPVFNSFTEYDAIATPGNPSGTDLRIYAKSDGKMYKLNSAGEEVELGAGGGSGAGEINYIENFTFDVNADGVNTTAPGAGTLTAALTNTAGELLRGDNSLKISWSGITGAPDGQVYWDYTLPEADENKLCKISFDLKGLTGGTDYAAGDAKIQIIKGPTGAPGSSGDNKTLTTSVEDLPAGQGLFTATWTSEEADAYRFLILPQTNTSDGITIDQLVIGPGQLVQGTPSADWIEYTVPGEITSTAGTDAWTSSNKVGRYKRVGDTIHLRVTYTVSAVTTISVAAYLHSNLLPPGLTVDGSQLQGARNVVGNANHFDGTNYHQSTVNNSNGSSFITFLAQDGGASADGVVDTSHPFTWASGDILSFECQLPIAEWAGSGNFGTNQVEYAFNTDTGSADNLVDFGYGPGGSTIGIGAAALGINGIRRRVRFRSKIQPNEQLRLELSTDAVKWQSVPTRIDDVAMTDSLTFDGTQYVGVGFCDNPGSSDTDIEVRFGRYRNAVSADWSAVSSYYWRVVKYSTGVPVAFGLADDQGNPGLSRGQVLWQKKNLTSDRTTDVTNIAEMQFTNLVVGKTYRLTYQARVQLAGSSGTDFGQLYPLHNGTRLGVIILRADSASGNPPVYELGAGSGTIFTAEATSLTFDWDQNGGSKTLRLVNNGTYAILEELPDHKEVSIW